PNGLPPADGIADALPGFAPGIPLDVAVAPVQGGGGDADAVIYIATLGVGLEATLASHLRNQQVHNTLTIFAPPCEGSACFRGGDMSSVEVIGSTVVAGSDEGLWVLRPQLGPEGPMNGVPGSLLRRLDLATYRVAGYSGFTSDLDGDGTINSSCEGTREQ